MEIKCIEDFKPQNFVYSYSYILKIIYDAFVNDFINKTEKLKLKSLLVKKHCFIQEFRDLYLNQLQDFDWSLLRKKLSLLEQDSPTTYISAHSPNLKKLHRTKYIQKDCQDLKREKTNECTKSFSKLKYINDPDILSKTNKTNKNHHIKCKNKLQETSDGLERKKSHNSNKCYYNIVDSKNFNISKLNFSPSNLSDPQKLEKNKTQKTSYFQFSSFNSNLNSNSDSNSNLITYIECKDPDSNKRKIWGSCAAASGSDNYTNNAKEEDSMSFELNNDSIYILKNLSQMGGFISDEEEAKNLSTTAGIDYNNLIDSTVNNNNIHNLNIINNININKNYFTKNAQTLYIKSIKRNLSADLPKEKPISIVIKKKISSPVKCLNLLDFNLAAENEQLCQKKDNKKIHLRNECIDIGVYNESSKNNKKCCLFEKVNKNNFSNSEKINQEKAEYYDKEQSNNFLIRKSPNTVGHAVSGCSRNNESSIIF